MKCVKNVIIYVMQYIFNKISKIGLVVIMILINLYRIFNYQYMINFFAPNALEWISYDRFSNIKYIAKGGFSTVYRANWIDGHMYLWNDCNNNWKRHNENMLWF